MPPKREPSQATRYRYRRRRKEAEIEVSSDSERSEIEEASSESECSRISEIEITPLSKSRRRMRSSDDMSTGDEPTYDVASPVQGQCSATGPNARSVDREATDQQQGETEMSHSECPPSCQESTSSDISDGEQGTHEQQGEAEATHSELSPSSQETTNSDLPDREPHDDLLDLNQGVFEENEPDDAVADIEENRSSDEVSSDEEIDLAPDADDEEYDQGGPPHHDPPLYAGSPITVAESLLAILTFSIVHHCTGVALADLLTLVALHCSPQNNMCIRTLYKFKKYFQDMKSPLILHYFCSNCCTALNSKDDVCQREECEGNSSVSYFIEISIISQLRSKFKRAGFWEKLNYRFERLKKNANHVEDVFDGRVYKNKVQDGFLSDRNNISFTWCSDGVSIFKSAKFEVWPFYLSINELPYSHRFKEGNTLVAGLWFGPRKPVLPMFLNAFHADLSSLYQGVNFDIAGHIGQKLVRGLVLCGTCDIPAKCHFLNTTYFNGYFGCPKCRTRGERSERTEGNHSYPFSIDPLRTDDETRVLAEMAEAHNTVIYGIKGFSALRMYVSDYITSTSVDIMHNMYQAVMKTLTKLWFDVEFSDLPFSLHAVSEGISQTVLSITPPSYFKRLPRSITETVKLWKAHEFKAWLFYYSIPVLFAVMNPEYFNHHLLLVHAVYMLNQSSISDRMTDEAEICLREYVAKFQDLYGYKYLSINFHMLLHLPENVRNLGPLWASSCMPFEDQNGQLKRLVHGTRYAALQITSGLSQVVNLPILLTKLDAQNSVRVYCEGLLNRNKISVTENISNTLSSVGKYVKLPNLPPFITAAIVDSGIALGNICQFFRLKKGRLLFASEAHRRSRKTCSSVAKFLSGITVRYGILQTFIRLSQCNCDRVCRCAADFYAIVSVLHCERPFNIAHPQLTLSFIHECVQGDAIAVPVEDLDVLCVPIRVYNKLYVVDPVNTIEDE